VHAPATEELFLAIAGGGATCNGRRITVSQTRSLALARVTGPRSIVDELLRANPGFEVVPRIHSLALRFARVASGEIDAALASQRSRDWDLAAADLLVHEAGGAFTTATGVRLVYDQPAAEHPSLVAAGIDLHQELIAAIGKTADAEDQ
jgi:myo-inositol-1(or 4)-monophosphatase